MSAAAYRCSAGRTVKKVCGGILDGTPLVEIGHGTGLAPHEKP
ncbi:hypothetical protein [Mobiluncus mulieris]|nr:hypothetical protein [Mobiluncus mulieris]